MITPHHSLSFLMLLTATFAVTTPAEMPTAAQQKHAVTQLTAQSVQSKVITDDAGNVTHLAISNHNAFMADKSAEPPTPLSPDLFREHIVKLPYLQAIALEKQHLGDAEYALLGQLKQLTDVRLHYMNEGERAATGDAPMFINELPLPLKVLEIKHNFRVRGGCMDKLKPQPELWKIELDTGYATNDAVPFIMAAGKNLRNLQLHRTTITDDRFRPMMDALPSLEIFELRPNGPDQNPITPASLEALTGLKHLHTLRLSQNWGDDIPYEGGLEALARIPSLKYLFFKPSKVNNWGPDHPAIQKLHEARPDLLIQTGFGPGIGGDGSTDRVPNIDVESNWDEGVTTHG